MEERVPMVSTAISLCLVCIEHIWGQVITERILELN